MAPMAAGAECLFMMSVGFGVRSAFGAVSSATHLTKDASIAIACVMCLRRGVLRLVAWSPLIMA